ncbi:site-specific integrase [Bradyrhizobium sp. AZCC 2230]|uniref:site-specific integrase n=1 Tax=Bradyrhizobium sp. AZCC 2230 TaxID=3117021 RepID=UPI002FF038B9
MTKLAPLITGFLRDYMPRQRGYSPESCETYAFSFKLLFDFAAKRLGTRPSRLTIEDLDAPLIVAFLAHIEKERGNGAATRNLRLAAIKSSCAMWSTGCPPPWSRSVASMPSRSSATTRSSSGI